MLPPHIVARRLHRIHIAIIIGPYPLIISIIGRVHRLMHHPRITLYPQSLSPHRPGRYPHASIRGSHTTTGLLWSSSLNKYPVPDPSSLPPHSYSQPLPAADSSSHTCWPSPASVARKHYSPLPVQLARCSRIGVPVRGRVTGEAGITVNTARGLAPARRRGKVINLVRLVRIGHLHFGKAGELPIVVIRVVIIVLIAPRVAMLAITALLCPDGGHRVLVAPRRADPIGHLRAPRQHDPAPVLVIGCPTQARRRLRSRCITGEGIIAHVAMRVVVRFLPGEIGVPPHPIVQDIEIQPIITLLPQDALRAVEAWDRRGTGTLGVGAEELIDIVLLRTGIAHHRHRSIEGGAIGAQLLDLGQGQIAGHALILPTELINARGGSALIVGEDILPQQVAR